MQRIEEKRIDNSSLVPRRIAEQRTDWRQPKPLGVDLSGLQRGFNALGKLTDFVGNEFEKANREMDELAEIKVNSIVKNAELEAKGKFENFSLTQLPNEIPGIRTAFSESVRNQIKDVPMTSTMREKVNAKLSAIDENMKVSMRYELDRKRANYVLNENINIYNDALQQGDTAVALKQREKLLNLGVKIKESEADIKSNGAFKALRESFDLNDFENIEKLEAAKDGKYTHFKELKHDDRIRLINYGKARQNTDYNNQIMKFAETLPTVANYENALADLEAKKATLPEPVYNGMKAMLTKTVNQQDKQTADNMLAALYINDTQIKNMDDDAKEAEFKKQLEKLNKLHISSDDRLSKIKTMSTFFRPTVKDPKTGQKKTSPELNYRNTYQYKLGMAIIEENKDSFKYTDGFWTRNKSDIKSANYGMAKMKMDEFIKANPNATENDIRVFAEKMKEDINATEQKNLIEAWQNYNVPDLSVKNKMPSADPQEERRSYNGRVAIFKDKKFVRWEN